MFMRHDDELARLMADLESDLVERKESLPSSKDRIYPSVQDDAEDHCLATLRNYRSLMPMAQEARKPMFDLTSADGAIGSHAQPVRVCEKDFRGLAMKVTEASGLPPR